jgi:hypothetical protein
MHSSNAKPGGTDSNHSAIDGVWEPAGVLTFHSGPVPDKSYCVFDTTVNRYHTLPIGVPGLSNIAVRHIPVLNADL